MNTISKIFSLLIILPIILLPQNIIRVPNDYPTIQSAIEHSKNYDTIIVGKGVFYELIEVEKTITISGSGFQETIIRPSSTFGLPIKINASNASLNNLWITASHNKYGIKVINSSNCVISNCRVDSTRPPLSFYSGDDGKGIYIDSSNNISVINCIIEKNYGGGSLPDGGNIGFGLYVDHSKNIKIHSSLIRKNEGGGPTRGDGIGIYITNSN